MRIISGKLKSKRIKAPAHLPVRPTTDMAKESLFNILANHYFFEEITALDLFAGTGNISYELASRGCKNITSVDNNYSCIKFISETAKKLQLFEIKPICQNSLDFISKTYEKYDLIFADPPFSYDAYEEIIEKVFDRKLLNPEGVLIIEHSEKKTFNDSIYLFDKRKYGSVHFSFFSQKTVHDEK
ncbi:16S rRNA (guanine(966)-N(2))-methyltransferase RsmD [Schleiferia thermophila]